MKWLLLVLLFAVLAAGAYVVVMGIRRVPNGYVGIVHRRYGRNHPGDRFKVRVFGGRGPQATTLEADRMYVRPRFIYTVEYVPQTYVPPGTIGVVVAKTGHSPPLDRSLCGHVECDYFQDGQAFLLGGGEAGRQPGILPGGASYDINPYLFEVLTVDTIGARRHDLTAGDLKEIVIREGSVGVVIVREGAPPDDDEEVLAPIIPGHASFQRPAVFLDRGGQRGAQEETLRGGIYRINPWFARIVTIPTKDLILEWSNKDEKSRGNYDASLQKIRINVEGHWLKFDLSQTIRIQPSAAPKLVGRFGEVAPVQRFVERELGRTVDGYFQATASSSKILNFFRYHDEVRLEVEDRVRQALAEWNIVAVRTTLGEFEPEDTALDDIRRQIAAERERRQVLEHQRENVGLEVETEKTRETARIAIERERRKLDAVVLEEQIRLLGEDAVALDRFLAHLKSMNVPSWVGGDANALLQYMPLPVAQDMINKVLRRPGIEVSADKPGEISPPGTGTTTDREQLEEAPSTRQEGAP